MTQGHPLVERLRRERQEYRAQIAVLWCCALAGFAVLFTIWLAIGIQSGFLL